MLSILYLRIFRTTYWARSLVLARPRDIQAPLGALCPPARAHATPYLNFLAVIPVRRSASRI